MEENLQNREEELKKLEKLHKKALDRRVVSLHRSTKVLFKPLQPVHFWLRDHSKIYYKWHASPISTLTHWTLLIISIVSFFYLFSLYNQVNNYKNSLPKEELAVIGQEVGAERVAHSDEESNVKIEKTRVELEDKKITIGVIRKKADLGKLVSWKNIEWSADTPEGTSIVYRFKSANEDRKEIWDKVQWSSFYKISGRELKTSGIPNSKSSYLMTEIILEGASDKTPTLNYVKFGYTPFNENKIVAFLKDKLVGGIAKIFKFLEKREGIQE